jgi:hypothetical protein
VGRQQEYSAPIRVNGVEIPEDAVNREMQYHPANSQPKAWLRAAQTLVVRELLHQRAREKGLLPSPANDEVAPDDENVIDLLLKQDIEVPFADAETCQRYYDMHPQAFFDKEKNTRLSFEEAEQWVRHYLHTKAMRAAISEYIKAIAAEADIEGVQLVNGEIPMANH